MAKQHLDVGYILTGKTSLDGYDRDEIGYFDKAKRWYPYSEYQSYFSDLRSPSRSWPFSYLRSVYTKKFARWLIENDPQTAADCGLIELTSLNGTETGNPASNDSSTNPKTGVAA